MITSFSSRYAIFARPASPRVWIRSSTLSGSVRLRSASKPMGSSSLAQRSIVRHVRRRPWKSGSATLVQSFSASQPRCVEMMRGCVKCDTGPVMQ